MSINALYKQLALEYSNVLSCDNKRFNYFLAKLAFKGHKKWVNKMEKERRAIKDYALVKGELF
jgi:hypothetical protein